MYYPLSLYQSLRYSPYPLAGITGGGGCNFPEDIQCVHESDSPFNGKIFISNIEAASNPQTYKSTLFCKLEFHIKAVLTCAKGTNKNIPYSLL